MSAPRLDLVCLGRAAVDLYAEQIGAPLEDAQSFAKSLGGCAANIAVGAARLGLRVGIVTRVGDEHMGRFVRKSLQAEGVDTSQVRTDPARLTGLVLLGIQDSQTFPLIFYRTDCADMALSVDDIDADYIASARALLLTGTHLSTPEAARASQTAAEHARATGARVILDIDYRPVLWGLAGLGRGEDRFVEAERVTQTLDPILERCDLIVGTEEEIHIAGGTTDTLQACHRIRAKSAACIVVKRGAEGAIALPAAIPSRLADGVQGKPFPVEVLNVLGAGDAFLAGFLSGWLRDEPIETSLRRGNAAGALVVTRHGCAPAMPTPTELEEILTRAEGVPHPDRDPRLAHLHRTTTGSRAQPRPELHVLAFDHRAQLEQMADELGAPRDRIFALKRLIASALQRAVQSHGAEHTAGAIVDDRWGSDALQMLTGSGLFIARPIEVPGSHESESGLEFEGGRDVGLTLRRWPQSHVVKCLVGYHPDGDPRLGRSQLERLTQLQEAAWQTDHELLLEPIPRDRTGRVDGAALPRTVQALYDASIRPDWWKLLPQADAAAWQTVAKVVGENDPRCRGILVLGLDAPEEKLVASFSATASTEAVRGFAVGRTIFAGPARSWLAGALDDAGLVDAAASTMGRMIQAWRDRGTVTTVGGRHG